MKYEESMLIEIIGDSLENRILDFLLEGKGIDYTITDIAEGCEISRPTIYKLIPDLLKEEVLEIKRKIGRIILYQLNEKNEKVKILRKLEQMLLKKSFEEAEEKHVVVSKS